MRFTFYAALVMVALNWVMCFAYIAHGSWLAVLWLFAALAWTTTTILTWQMHRSRYH